MAALASQPARNAIPIVKPTSQLLELLGQLKALSLIVRTDVLPVQKLGPSRHTLISKPSDRLPMLEQERHLVRAHFQNSPAASRFICFGIPTESRIKKTGIMNPEFTCTGVVRHHLSRIIRRHRNRFFRHQDIEFMRVQYQGKCFVNKDWLPEIQRLIIPPFQVDTLSIFSRTISDYVAGFAGTFQIHRGKKYTC